MKLCAIKESMFILSWFAKFIFLIINLFEKLYVIFLGSILLKTKTKIFDIHGLEHEEINM